MSNIRFPFWQNVRKLLVDMRDGTYAERVEAFPPAKLQTEGGDSEFDRLKVAVGRSCFFAGRQRYTFYQFNIPNGDSQVIKVVAPVNTILLAFGASLNIAALRIELVAGGTEGGTFGTPLPILAANSTTTVGNYVSQVTMATGGTHTGGTVVNVLELLSGVPARQSVASIANENEPLGFSPGTYYIRLINTDGAAATGVFRARWEERP
jgi:hypothetical protein